MPTLIPQIAAPLNTSPLQDPTTHPEIEEGSIDTPYWKRSTSPDTTPEATAWSQPQSVTMRQLGDLTDIKPEPGSWVVQMPFDPPGGYTGSSDGTGAITGKIEIYKVRGKYVHPDFLKYIDTALRSNRFSAANYYDGGRKLVMPSINPTNEWVALILSIIDIECMFGYEKASYTGGPYPNGTWRKGTRVNDEGLGPMQITNTGSYKGIEWYGGDAVMSNTEYNIHAGVHHLWTYFTYPTGGKSKDGPFRPSTESIDWHDFKKAVAMFNGGPSATYPGPYTQPTGYSHIVCDLHYPWYLERVAGAREQEAAASLADGSISGKIKKMQEWFLYHMPSSLAGMPGQCVKTARAAIAIAYPGLELKLVPMNNSKYGISDAATTRGLAFKNRTGGLTAPPGWKILVPPATSPNGIVYYDYKDGKGYGHVAIKINGLIYDQYTGKNKKPTQRWGVPEVCMLVSDDWLNYVDAVPVPSIPEQHQRVIIAQSKAQQANDGTAPIDAMKGKFGGTDLLGVGNFNRR